MSAHTALSVFTHACPPWGLHSQVGLPLDYCCPGRIKRSWCLQGRHESARNKHLAFIALPVLPLLARAWNLDVPLTLCEPN